MHLQNRAKKHHYNPNFILKRFADPQSKVLWVLDKEFQKIHPVRGKKTSNRFRYDAFAENHYNRIIDKHGKTDLSVEDYLADIESKAAPIVDLIVRACKAGIYPAISRVDIEDLARFCHVQNMRSPAIRREVKTSDASRQEYEDIRGCRNSIQNY